MNSSTDHEKIFFNYFLKKPHYLKSTGPGFFSNNDLDHIAKLSKKFYTDFGESPSREQMKALIKDDPNEIPDSIVSSRTLESFKPSNALTVLKSNPILNI